MGRNDSVRLSLEPEEVHTGDEDGLRWIEETGRSRGFDLLFERCNEVICISAYIYICILL
jgi:hypothetical protein